MDNNINRLKIIGVTGGSGAGKGNVCRILEKLGGHIIDTDSLSHQIILRGQPAYNELVGSFGMDIVGADGEINRRTLGKIVFTDESKRKRLNRIVHRYVIEQSEEIILRATKDGGCRFIVIDAPLLHEAGMDKMCDSVWGVFAPCSVRIRRIMKRDGITREAAQRRIDSQLSDTELRRLVDFQIENDGGLNDLNAYMEELLINVLYG